MFSNVVLLQFSPVLGRVPQSRAILFLDMIILPENIITLEHFSIVLWNFSAQFSSVAQLCLTLCDPMDCSTPGFPVHHQLLEFTQTHVH